LTRQKRGSFGCRFFYATPRFLAAVLRLGRRSFEFRAMELPRCEGLSG